MITDTVMHWDAAYVVGALAATERRDFKHHLTVCTACSVAVAELAGLPGLLAKVPVHEVESLIESSPALPVAATLLPRLVRCGGRGRCGRIGSQGRIDDERAFRRVHRARLGRAESADRLGEPGTGTLGHATGYGV
jgi:anti-sigma factor RsiW